MRRACSTEPQLIGGRTDIVRKATANDLPGIVTIHQKAFANFFLTRIGSEFLRKYYTLVLNYHSGIMLVSERQSELRGFACGFGDPAEFYQLMWRRRLTFAPPVLFALVRHPSLISKVLNGVQRIHTQASEWTARCCELSRQWPRKRAATA
jgi:hypothetical protein